MFPKSPSHAPHSVSVGVEYDHYFQVCTNTLQCYRELQLLHLYFRSFANYFDWLNQMDNNLQSTDQIYEGSEASTLSWP